jgi:nitroimidazol reductase NimA-like FMN-containing flavoprotein (pyridoxamine 5'-phosphate oxidase superfamily)
MRRMDKAVTGSVELVKPLIEAEYIIIALSYNDHPYLATLSHGYDAEKNCIYFHCAPEGKKIEYMKTNPMVWGQALLDYGYQHGSCDHLYHTAQFNGTVSFVDNLEEKRHALKLMINKLDENPEEVIKKQLLPNSVAKITIGKITLQQISGKKADKIIISL